MYFCILQFYIFLKDKKKSLEDIIILHLRTKNIDMIYSSWVWQTESGDFGSFFALPPTSDNQQSQNFGKWEKCLDGDIIILHTCTINHNHNVWFLRYQHDSHNFLSFWTIFCPSTSLKTLKIKIWKTRWKQHAWRCHHFTEVYHNWYDVWFLIYGARQINFLSLWDIIICPCTPLTTQKIKILKKLKKKKKHLGISSNVPKIMIICYTVPEKGVW